MAKDSTLEQEINTVPNTVVEAVTHYMRLMDGIELGAYEGNRRLLEHYEQLALFPFLNYMGGKLTKQELISKTEELLFSSLGILEREKSAGNNGVDSQIAAIKKAIKAPSEIFMDSSDNLNENIQQIFIPYISANTNKKQNQIYM